MLINNLFLNSLNLQLNYLTVPNNFDSALNMYYTINLLYTTSYNKIILLGTIKLYTIAYYSFTIYFIAALFLLCILEPTLFWLIFLVICSLIIFNLQNKVEFWVLKVSSFSLKNVGLTGFSGDLIYFDDNVNDAPESSTDNNDPSDSVESPSLNEPANSNEPTNSDEIKTVLPSP